MERAVHVAFGRVQFTPHKHTHIHTHTLTHTLTKTTRTTHSHSFLRISPPISTMTAEAKAFNAALADFKKKGAEVFGISSVRTADATAAAAAWDGEGGG